MYRCQMSTLHLTVVFSFFPSVSVARRYHEFVTKLIVAGPLNPSIFPCTEFITCFSRILNLRIFFTEFYVSFFRGLQSVSFCYIGIFELNRKLLPCRKTKQRKIREKSSLIQESWKHVMSLTFIAGQSWGNGWGSRSGWRYHPSHNFTEERHLGFAIMTFPTIAVWIVPIIDNAVVNTLVVVWLIRFIMSVIERGAICPVISTTLIILAQAHPNQLIICCYVWQVVFFIQTSHWC